MSNNATTLGVNLVNKNRQAQVEEQAASLIKQILDIQTAIKARNKSIEIEQAALRELALDVVTQSDVLGTELSTPLNPNQVTIVNAIKKINDARQESVGLKSQVHINRIENEKQCIVTNEKLIGELKEKLSKLAVDVVTVEGVAGSQQ